MRTGIRRPPRVLAIVRLDLDDRLDLGFGGSRHGHRHRGMLLLRSKSINDIAVHRGHIFIAGEEVQRIEEFGEAGYVERFGGISFDHAGRIYAGS